MKNMEILNGLRGDMFKAASAYLQAVIDNLKEYGKELEVVSDYWDPEDGLPKGVKVTSLSDNGVAFQCIVDRIRYREEEPVCKASVHVVMYDGQEINQWWGLSDLIDEAADYVLSSIRWPEDGEVGPQKVWVVTEESNDDGEIRFLVQPCRDEATARRVMKEWKQALLSEHVKYTGAKPYVDGKKDPDDQECCYEWDESDHGFYIKVIDDDYYEDISIIEKQLI